MDIYLSMDERPGSASRMWGERLARLFARRGYGISRDLDGDWAAALFLARAEGMPAALRRGRPVGFRVANGYHPAWFAALGKEMKPAHHAVNAALSRALETASVVIYQSQWAKGELDGLLYRRAQDYAVIHNGTDLELFRPPAARPAGPPVIGSVGRLRYRYRLETLFEMSRRLELPHRLLVVGDVDEECAAVLARFQADPLIGPRLDYHPHVPPQELPALYGQMSLLAHPVSGDACPNVVVEALACGTPVIAPSHGGTAELVGEAGAIFENRPWVYDEAFVEAMARAAAQLLPRAAQLSPLARERAERLLDVERTADRYLEALGLPPRAGPQRESRPAGAPRSLRSLGAALVARPRYYAAAALRRAGQAQRRLFPRPRNPRPRLAFTLFDFQVGGIENWLYRLARALRGEFDFYFLSTRHPEPLPRFAEVGRCAFLPGPAQMSAYLRRHNMDLVQVHNERWPVDAALAAGVPHVIERLGGQRSWRRVPKWGLERIVASSQMAARAVADLAPAERIVVIYNGVDLEAADAAAPLRLFPPDTLVVGRTSRFGRGQNLGLLIEALARLRPRFPELRLALVGGDSPLPGAEPVAEALRAQAQEAGLEDCVAFTGPLEDPLPHILGFDIGTCVSNDEGLPNSLLEAMACRKPVISSAVGAVPELLQEGENGLLFPAGDLEALCACLERLAGDPGLRRRLGEAGRRTVEARFSLSEAAAQYAALYRELLEG